MKEKVSVRSVTHTGRLCSHDRIDFYLWKSRYLRAVDLK